MDDTTCLPAAPHRVIVPAPRAGYITALDAESIGRASVVLGAGRDRVEDPIDPAVGVVLSAKPRDFVREGDPVLELHYRDPSKRDVALPLASRAIVVGDQPPPARAMILADIR